MINLRQLENITFNNLVNRYSNLFKVMTIIRKKLQKSNENFVKKSLEMCAK